MGGKISAKIVIFIYLLFLEHYFSNYCFKVIKTVVKNLEKEGGNIVAKLQYFLTTVL